MINQYSSLEFIDDLNIYKKRDDFCLIIINFQHFSRLFFEKNRKKGIYLGNKNKVIENENIYISGMTNGENQIIEWSFEKIS